MEVVTDRRRGGNIVNVKKSIIINKDLECVSQSMENEEVNYYKPRFTRWIKSNKWDSIAERLSDTYMEIITRVIFDSYNRANKDLEAAAE